ALFRSNVVVVGLAHLAPVDAGQHARVPFGEDSLGDAEGVAVPGQVVKRPCDVSGVFDVLGLVAADRDQVGLHDEDVDSHEDGVVVQPHVDAGVQVGDSGGGVAVARGLVGVGAVHQAFAGDAGEDPGQFERLGNVGLDRKSVV